MVGWRDCDCTGGRYDHGSRKPGAGRSRMGAIMSLDLAAPGPRLPAPVMTRSLAETISALSETEARSALLRVCASSRWAAAMIAARPFASDAALFDAAERSWWALDRADWLEALAAHPRIGDGVAAGPGHSATREWSRQEQARAATASPEVRTALAAGNAEYERRFGHVFLICATGRPADEILAELRRRLENDPAAEIREAAGEQAKITRLRLARLAAP